jgi:hypothetical protein
MKELAALALKPIKDHIRSPKILAEEINKAQTSKEGISSISSKPGKAKALRSFIMGVS